jgi:hypothetical protein
VIWWKRKTHVGQSLINEALHVFWLHQRVLQSKGDIVMDSRHHGLIFRLLQDKTPGSIPGDQQVAGGHSVIGVPQHSGE